jgi:cyclic pyranopterin phosphate synthase
MPPPWADMAGVARTDGFGRPVTDLRISLTQECNLRCVFCHMEGQPPERETLTAEEIERCVRAASQVGIDRVKLTGGEPTLRADLMEIVRRIRPWVTEISMTTNGLLLSRLASDLRRAGLDRVNVSLPTLRSSTYREITGSPRLEDVIQGLRAAREAGLGPLKINVVALRGLNGGTRDVQALVELAQELEACLQLIEFEPVSGRVDPRVYEALHAELEGLAEEARQNRVRTEYNRLHGRPRYTFLKNGRPLQVEVVQPVNNPDFCMACHRIRLTSFGGLKGCLMTNDGLVDLRPALRAGASPEELVPFFERVIATRRPFYLPQDEGRPPEGIFEGSPLPVVRSGSLS